MKDLREECLAILGRLQIKYPEFKFRLVYGNYESDVTLGVAYVPEKYGFYRYAWFLVEDGEWSDENIEEHILLGIQDFINLRKMIIKQFTDKPEKNKQTNFHHSCDYNDCHYIRVNDKYYELGFGENPVAETYPTPMKEIDPCELPLLLQEEFGHITTAVRILLQYAESDEKAKEYKETRRLRFEVLKAEYEVLKAEFGE